MNVLMFEPYPFSEAGNLKTQSYILKLVDRKRFKLVFLAPFESPFMKKVSDLGVECVVLAPPQRLVRYGGKALRDTLAGKFLTLLSMLPYTVSLLKLIKEKEIDLVYCNGIRAVLTVGFAAKLSRRPLLWYIKGELDNPLLDRLGFMLSDRILFFCGANRDDKYPGLVRKYKRKIGVLKIGMDMEPVYAVEKKNRTALKREFNIDAEKTNIVYLGQFYPPKGIHFLVEALGHVVKDFPRVMLYLVGDPIIEEYKGYRQELDRLVKKYKLEDRVVFTGWRPDALEIASLMDILVHPSLAEGFGRAVLEGMALGKPVIASRVGGLREAIRDGANGFLVEPGKPGAIAEKLSVLIKDKNLRNAMGKAARETVFSEYRIEDKIRQLERVWMEMADAS